MEYPKTVYSSITFIEAFEETFVSLLLCASMFDVNISFDSEVGENK